MHATLQESSRELLWLWLDGAGSLARGPKELATSLPEAESRLGERACISHYSSRGGRASLRDQFGRRLLREFSS